MNTPIFNALLQLAKNKPYSYHTPGHKNGRSLPKDIKTLFESNYFFFDTTEITGMDNLLSPKGIIAESQAYLSHIHGAKFALYLLGGTTQGLLASLLAFAQNDTVFIPRHAHRSIYHGLILANATPFYLLPTLDDTHHIPLGISLATLKKAIKEQPNCKVLVLVNPTYHGITWQNEDIIRFAKEKGLLVIVDEAHGAHFSFSPFSPKSALDFGADIVITSYHKTLPSFTQGSVLFCNNSNLKAPLDKALKLIATTSPSYPILASMELAGNFMFNEGASYLGEGLKKISNLKKHLNLKTIRILDSPSWKKDPFRWYLKSDRLSGEQFKVLIEKENCFIELYDDGILLLLPFNDDVTLNHLKLALEKIDQLSLNFPLLKRNKPFYKTTLPTQSLSLNDAFYKNAKKIALKDSLNQISASFLEAYPPGIPQIVPGEMIDKETLTLWSESGHSLDEVIEVIS